MLATAIWIPLPLARSGAASSTGLSTKGGTQPLSDSRKIVSQKEVVTWLRSQDSSTPRPRGRFRPHPSPLSTPTPLPPLGRGPVCPRLAADCPRLPEEAYLRPAASAANLLLLGQPTRPRLRGLSGARGASPAPHLQPASRAPTRNRTFAAHRKWLRVGAVSSRACAHTQPIGAPANCLDYWARTATGSGHLYLGCPAIATSACAGPRIPNGLHSTAKNFPSEVGGAPWLTRPWGRRYSRAGPSATGNYSKNYNAHLAHCDPGFNSSVWGPSSCRAHISYNWKKFLELHYPCSAPDFYIPQFQAKHSTLKELQSCPRKHQPLDLLIPSILFSFLHVLVTANSKISTLKSTK